MAGEHLEWRIAAQQVLGVSPDGDDESDGEEFPFRVAPVHLAVEIATTDVAADTAAATGLPVTLRFDASSTMQQPSWQGTEGGRHWRFVALRSLGRTLGILTTTAGPIVWLAPRWTASATNSLVPVDPPNIAAFVLPLRIRPA